MLMMLFAFALSACSMGTSSSSGDGRIATANVGIIGGEVVSAKHAIAKSTALLLLYNSQTNEASFCSSVLVANDIVLSAAHCFYDEASGRLRGSNFIKFVIFKTSIDIQSADAFAGAYVIPENGYVVHPKYSNKTLENDIAVVHLPKALQPGLVPAKILTSMKGVSSVTLAGFGLSAEMTGAPRVSVLKLLKTSLSTRRDPAAPLAIAVRTSSTGRPMTGDSGGPAFATVGGVTSVWGLDSHALDSIDREYYTPIAPYLEFVKQSAKMLGSKGL